MDDIKEMAEDIVKCSEDTTLTRKRFYKIVEGMKATIKRSMEGDQRWINIINAQKRKSKADKQKIAELELNIEKGKSTCETLGYLIRNAEQYIGITDSWIGHGMNEEYLDSCHDHCRGLHVKEREERREQMVLEREELREDYPDDPIIMVIDDKKIDRNTLYDIPTPEVELDGMPNVN